MTLPDKEHYPLEALAIDEEDTVDECFLLSFKHDPAISWGLSQVLRHSNAESGPKIKIVLFDTCARPLCTKACDAARGLIIVMRRAMEQGCKSSVSRN